MPQGRNDEFGENGNEKRRTKMEKGRKIGKKKEGKTKNKKMHHSMSQN